MTAHPTEARRRTTIDKQARDLRGAAGARRALGRDRRAARGGCCATVQELWGSDELRALSLTVSTRCAAASSTSPATLADAIPRIYRDLEEALREFYPEAADSPRCRRCSASARGSAATATATRSSRRRRRWQALALLREQCLRFLEARLELLAGRLSLSERLDGSRARASSRSSSRAASASRSWRERLAGPQPGGALPARADVHARARPRDARRRSDGGYAEPDELLADLRRARGVAAPTGGSVTAAGDLRDVIRQVEVFGFHFATLDIREHAQVHRAALAEIFGALGRLRRLRGAARATSGLTLLQAHIADRRPLIPADIDALLRGDARDDRDLPHDLRTRCSRAAPRCDRRPTSSPAPRARPTCSRCCC